MPHATLLASAPIASALVVAATLAAAPMAAGQSWGVVGGSVSKQGQISTIPGGVTPFNDVQTLSPNPGLGPNVFTVYNQAIQRQTQPCGTGLSRCLDKAQATGWARVDANGAVLDVKLLGDARVKHTCPVECCLPWNNDAQVDRMVIDLTLEVNGVPPGTVVDVSWSSDVVLSVFGRHESGAEDPITVDPPNLEVTYVDGGGTTNTGDLLTGTIPGVTDNPFVQTLTSKILQQRDGSSGVIQVVAGTDVQISLVLQMMTAHHEPGGAPIGPKPPACMIGWEDGDGTEFFAKMRFRLGSMVPPIIPGVTPPNPFLPTSRDVEFSLDIGSDAELSEMINPPPGRPQFDPGDMYAWMGAPLPPGGLSGVRDDLLGLGGAGFVFDPEPGSPLLPPLCSFGPLPSNDFLDLDGFDAIDFDLAAAIAPGLIVPFFQTDHVFEPDTVVISADDDMGSNYTACDVPVNSISPGLRTYGESTVNDELIELDVTVPFGLVGPAATTALPLLDERDLHFGLSPSPDISGQAFDDDTDALDINWGSGQGPVWVFTVDHEASAGLDPGAIYQTTAGGAFTPVAGPNAIGLPAGTDVDAIELCWLSSPQGLVLALLFSVDTDDPATVDDESGGLNPGLIYVSVFDGTARLFADWANGDDIDAIAVWHRSIVGTLTPCPGDLADSTGFGPPDGQVDFGDFFALSFLAGPCGPGTPNPACDGDLADSTGFGPPDSVIDFGDFFALSFLAGPCP